LTFGLSGVVTVGGVVAGGVVAGGVVAGGVVAGAGSVAVPCPTAEGGSAGARGVGVAGGTSLASEGAPAGL